MPSITSKHWSALLLSIAVLSSCSAAARTSESSADNRVLAGWVERVQILESGDFIKAKLDTGAKTSSINASDIERFEKNNRRWVRFQLSYKTTQGQMRKLQLERPLVRNIRVKEHDRENNRRPVVMLQFCFAGQIHSTQFSLVDRSKFVYPVLLGRRFLQDATIIDPKATFLTQPNCKRAMPS